MRPWAGPFPGNACLHLCRLVKSETLLEPYSPRLLAPKRVAVKTKVTIPPLPKRVHDLVKLCLGGTCLRQDPQHWYGKLGQGPGIRFKGGSQNPGH